MLLIIFIVFGTGVNKFILFHNKLACVTLANILSIHCGVCCKVHLWAKMFLRVKHTSLLYQNVNYAPEKFYSIWRRSQSKWQNYRDRYRMSLITAGLQQIHWKKLQRNKRCYSYNCMNVSYVVPWSVFKTI